MVDNLVPLMKPEKNYHCSYAGCNACFTKTFRLNRHLRSHREERPFICDIDGCEKAFTCKSYLNKHKKRPHSDGFGTEKKARRKERRYNCEECLKEFNCKFTLKIHLAQHTGEKPFKCDQCTMAFALKGRLLRHKRRHQGYKCSHSDCNHVAETWTGLRKHLAIDHKPTHNCNQCDRMFTTKANLRNHIQAHKFACPTEGCNKMFVLKSHLTKHIKDSHSLPTLKCPENECDKEFNNEIIRTQHLLSHLELENPENISSTKKVVFPCRTIFAEKLSGYEPTEKERKAIISEDRDFRKEMTIIV